MLFYPGMISAYLAERAKQEAHWKAIESNICRELLAGAPDVFTLYFENVEGVIERIVKYGESHERYTKEDFQSFGFRSFQSFNRQLPLLRKAWAGVVTVETNWNDRGRWNVIFRAV